VSSTKYLITYAGKKKELDIPELKNLSDWNKFAWAVDEARMAIRVPQ
jgi:hypothetical protein